MNIFLCHTPLHLLIAMLEAPRHDNIEILYFIVEDAPNMHSLARSLLASEHAKFVMLPGTASNHFSSEAVLTQKENVKRIRLGISDLLPDSIFIYFDQRAEAQALLNHKFRAKPKVVWLEDGLTTYDVASPFPRHIRRLIKHKFRFDLHWKGSKWLGQHPAIDEVYSFYPDLVRADLRSMRVKPLLRTLDKIYVDRFKNIYGRPKYNFKVGIIVVPHPDSGPTKDQIEKFILEAIDKYLLTDIQPVLKFHPRDDISAAQFSRFKSNIPIAEKTFPLELIIFVEENVRSVVGYRTSALHVISALHESVRVIYYEPQDAKMAVEWKTFYKTLSIEPLSRSSI